MGNRDTPTMLSDEYEFMKGRGHEGAAGAAIFEFCIEFGWLDHLGILTAQGQKAIEEYERLTHDPQRSVSRV